MRDYLKYQTQRHLAIETYTYFSMTLTFIRMKIFLQIILIIMSFTAFGQNSFDLNDYILKIDNSVFTDTISFERGLLDRKVVVQGFFINDTIVKARIDYPNLNRTREVYYKEGANVLHDVCYVREYDTETGKEHSEKKPTYSSGSPDVAKGIRIR